ncbi:MAG: arsenate reductase ArsC [Chloroflexi bacterium]|jgi:arsenate reductase|uniref:Low molecular weight phosphatase family protein n=1 Tax=Candidatus Thermofonsia Clade 3 bacterium TaxID=2364212 RepID=A0A2M8QF31_9CHLR|nr:arsenate reductase ArsC [Candidatus Roseilinea sp. NK_OTU-006]PJF48368.1 MAG: low molecular weight phosphatase family protein [Candidatus Thermofonsia Clade 3 bacterium]RMG62516.1 MAG: arsenate reductase ArsC [Chloroflexota bacterium]
MPKSNVLFLCTGNSARSQMAEAFLRHYASDLFNAYSAGLEPKGMNPFTVRVMNEIGISVEGQYSKSLREYLGKQLFAYLVTVCADAEARCPSVWPGVQFRLHWKFDDPAAFEGTEEEKLAKFREVRDQIKAAIEAFVAQERAKYDTAAASQR